MYELIKDNRERWNALVRANVEYSLPFMDYTKAQAETFVYRHSMLKDVAGKSVLCLASGGGQDSAAFGLLGAEVTVFDLSDEQLANDRKAAAHHRYPVTTIQGDMRDLSVFPTNQFDIVWQTYSLNFVPDVNSVFQGVVRILKPQGVYFLMFANPFVIGIDEEAWDGKAYALNSLYRDGEDMSERFPDWDVEQADGSTVKLISPHEFRHTLSSVMNNLVRNGFILTGVWEWMRSDANPEPGTWAHYTQVAPPYLSTFWRLNK